MYKSPEDRAKIIADEVSELLYINARLQRRIDALEIPTDERLAAAQEEIKRLRIELGHERVNSLYTFSKEESNKNKELCRKHNFSCRGKYLHYEVVGTGLGSVCYLCCKLCGFHEEVGNTIG